MAEENTLVETYLVGMSWDKEKNNPVMIVGTKDKNGTVGIVNAFDGLEAVAMYYKLTGQKVPKAEVKED